MAANKEAIVVVLDVGRSMGLMANHKGDSFLDLAVETITWIVHRKIFQESKDEIGLVLFGSKETKNALAEEEEGQYENVEEVRPVQTPDFQLIHYLDHNISHTHIDGDFFDGIVVGLNVLKESTEGRKFGKKTIVLISNMGAPFSEDNADVIKDTMKSHDVELTVIGPDPREDEDEEGGGEEGGAAGGRDDAGRFTKKTGQMMTGEEKIKEIFDSGVVGECYTLVEALDSLRRFQKRNTKTTAWKATLEMGEEVGFGICMYRKTQEHTVKQSWKKKDGKGEINPDGTITYQDVQSERLFIKMAPDEDQDNDTFKPASDAPTDQQAETNGEVGNVASGSGNTPKKTSTIDDMQVDEKDVIKGYRFGSTVIPFTEEDIREMKYHGEGKTFQLVGFVKRDKIQRHLYVGDGVYYVVGDPADDAGCVALSSLVQGMGEEEVVGVVRYAYSKASVPRLGVLVPKESKKGAHVLIFTVLPYEEDIRMFTFPTFGWTTEPSDEQNNAVDDLIDSMNLADAKVDEDGRRVEAKRPREILNPQVQYQYQCLAARALRADDPLPDPELRFMSPLEPLPEHSAFASEPLKKIKGLFRLQRWEKKKEKRTAEQVFGNVNGETRGAGPEKVGRWGDVDPPVEEKKVKRQIGTVDPVEDFDNWVTQVPTEIDNAGTQLGKVVKQFVFDTLDSLWFGKALKCLQAWREAGVQYNNPEAFNEFLRGLKEQLITKNRSRFSQFWNQIVEGKVGLIPKSESAASGVENEETERFLTIDEPVKVNIETTTSSAHDEDLLDEME